MTCVMRIAVLATASVVAQLCVGQLRAAAWKLQDAVAR
jgi:hypothetical protein